MLIQYGFSISPFASASLRENVRIVSSKQVKSPGDEEEGEHPLQLENRSWAQFPTLCEPRNAFSPGQRLTINP
jgi:hypothetical protein